ncbi:MAG: peptidyl-prolyl cis-trans isomerase [Schaedlerella sp.]|nr:peptidyl-prolyl cis-trans isomerase [Schaedlerella sp.]
MKYWTKKAAAVLLAGGILPASLTGCGSEAIDHSEVVVTVAGEEVPLGVANFSARMDQASVESYYESMMGTSVGSEIWSSEVEEGVTYEDSVKEGIMESLQNLYLLKQHAKEYGVELTDEDKAEIDEAVAEFDEDNSLEEKELISGDEEYVRTYLELKTIQAKMEKSMKEGVDEVVSDEEAAQKAMSYVYLEFNTTDADGNSVEMTEKEKEELKAKADALVASLKRNPGTTIDTVAPEYKVEVSKVTFDSESVSPNADFIAAAEGLEAAGDVTDVIETDYGYYVGQLTSLMDDAATEAKKLEIVEERKTAQYTELLELWKKAAEITVNDDVWAKIDFKTIVVTYKDTSEEYDNTTE